MSALRDQEQSKAREGLAPDLALLLDAMRSENAALLDARIGKLTNRLLMMGIPLGAVGGFAAEMVKPGVIQQGGKAALGFLLGV